MRISRRRFLVAGLAGVGVGLSGYAIYRMGKHVQPIEPPKMSEVYITEASNRVSGTKKLMSKLNSVVFKGKKVALKANYNSADPFPASTHTDTLQAIVEGLKDAGSAEIVLAERSGMGNTRRVLEDRGVFKLANNLGFKTVVLDEVSAEGWTEIGPDGLHWLRGFKIAKIFTEAERVVQTCCLKTHRFGGHFTMSLKNSVGLVAKRDPSGAYDYMIELHTSPFQRLMIAEVNRFYRVDMVIMDATEGFVNGGPEQGELVKPDLMLASKDRVAIDAVGVAILRSYGTTPEVTRGSIFNLEQIRRAAELGVGVTSPSSIKLVSLDRESEKASETIQKMLTTH